jgi:hypothetical protein
MVYAFYTEGLYSGTGYSALRFLDAETEVSPNCDYKITTYTLGAKKYELIVYSELFRFHWRCDMQIERIRHYVSYSDVAAAQVPEEEQITQKRVGLWIDHRKAVIVTLTDTNEGPQIKQVISHLENDTRPAAGWSAHSGQDFRSNAEDRQERRFVGHLDRYYDEVISAVRDVRSIFVFGPGKAKIELKKRIEDKGPKGRKVVIEAADEMTDPQIAARVRQHFLK